jgi:hypothetical protein
MERASNLRLIALAGIIALAATVPLAAALAEPAGSPAPKGAGLLDALVGDVGAAGAGSGGVAGTGGTGDTRQTAVCGPRLSEPGGLRAQTCTIREDGDTWARTYYRNATGEPLSGMLSLMRPDGRTVQARCLIGARAAAGICETPRERTVRATAEPYSAVAEIAAGGPEDAERLLLRSGSGAGSAAGH